MWVGLLPLAYGAGDGTHPNGAVATPSEVQSCFWSVALTRKYLLKGPCASRASHTLWLGRIGAQLPGPFRILMDFLPGAPRLAERGWSPSMGHFRVHNWTEGCVSVTRYRGEPDSWVPYPVMLTDPRPSGLEPRSGM